MQYKKLDDQTMSILDDNDVLLYNISIPGKVEQLITAHFSEEDTNNKISDLQSALPEIQQTIIDIEDLLQHARDCGFTI